MIYIVTFSISTIVFAIVEYSRIQYKAVRNILCFIGLLLPVMLAALRADTVGTDVEVYGISFYKSAINASSFSDYYEIFNYQLLSDPLYFVLTLICAKISSDYHFGFFVYAILTVGLYYKGLVYFKKKYNISATLGMLLFFLTMFNPSLNIIRQMIAVSIAFFSIGFLLEGKNKIFIFLSIVATLFHSSGIICFAILGMYKFLKMNNNKSDVKQLVRALFFIAALVVVLMMSDYVIRILVEQRILRKNYLNYLSGGDYATAKVALSTLVAPAIYFAISLSGYNRIKKMSTDSLFFLMAALIYFFAAFGSGISTYISRFSYYFLPLVLIMLLMICKSYRKQNRTIMYSIITVFVFGVWYYEIVYMGYGETVPYLFYWQ